MNFNDIDESLEVLEEELENTAFDLDPDLSITKLAPRLIQSAMFMPVEVARDLVRSYYSVQTTRLKLDNQIRATRTMVCPACEAPLVNRKGLVVSIRVFTCPECGAEGEDAIDATSALYVREAIAAAEERSKKLLDKWTSQQPLSVWSRQVIGIGPILAAGLLAEIDIHRAAHVSGVWRFAGLDPTAVWEKGQKRPYNAFLKILCWRVGDSFVKVSGNPNSVYGAIYRAEKTRLTTFDANGGFAEAAKERLESKIRIPSPGTEARKALESGHFPKAQLDLRARRKAVKMFLSHYWVAGRTIEGLSISTPYVIEKLGHTHVVEPEVPYPQV